MQLQYIYVLICLHACMHTHVPCNSSSNPGTRCGAYFYGSSGADGGAGTQQQLVDGTVLRPVHESCRSVMVFHEP